jgi:hypothetical protein
MAEDNIDKALPNEPRKEFNIPGEEEIQETLVEEVKAEQESPDDVEVQENEDGSVDINLDPNAASPEGGDEHYANLAEFLPDDVLSSLASDLNSRYMDYTSSRKDWEKTYTQGLDLLGFKYDNRTEPFSGASRCNPSSFS